MRGDAGSLLGQVLQVQSILGSVLSPLHLAQSGERALTGITSRSLSTVSSEGGLQVLQGSARRFRLSDCEQ